jgi:hypothetical protein
MGNRFHAPFLHELRGQRVNVRFDPQAITEDLHVYSQAGAYLGVAPCIEAIGFDDADAAREHARAITAWRKGVKLQLEAETKLGIAGVAALMAMPPVTPAPETKIVRPVFRTQGTAALKAEEAPDGHTDIERRFLASVATLRTVPREEEAAD